MRDVNDNPPKFDCSPYHISVSESVSPQHTLLQLHATDLDKNTAPLQYRFGPGMSELTSMFSLDADTGHLVLLTDLGESWF